MKRQRDSGRREAPQPYRGRTKLKPSTWLLLFGMLTPLTLAKPSGAVVMPYRWRG